MNILITAASSSYSYKLEKELPEGQFIFADSVDLPAVLMKNKKFVRIPAGDSAVFAHTILSICLDLGVNKVFPLRKAEIKSLAEARQLFDEYGIAVIVPQKELLDELSGPLKAGIVYIKESAGDGKYPTPADRGVFFYDVAASPQLQLLTAD